MAMGGLQAFVIVTDELFCNLSRPQFDVSSLRSSIKPPLRLPISPRIQLAGTRHLRTVS